MTDLYATSTEEADLKASRQLVNPVVTELHCCVNVCTDTEELLLTVVWRRSSPPAPKLMNRKNQRVTNVAGQLKVGRLKEKRVTTYLGL